MRGGRPPEAKRFEGEIPNPESVYDSQTEGDLTQMELAMNKPFEKRMKSSEIRERDRIRDEALDRVRDEVKVLPCPTSFKTAIVGGGPNDELWDRVYRDAYRRMVKVGRVVGLPVSGRAAIVADVVVWRMVPWHERPHDGEKSLWPARESEIAAHHGLTITQLRRYLSDARAQRWLDKSPWKAEELVAEVDRKLHQKAISELESTSKKVEATTLWYKRHGLLQDGRGRNLTVNVGPHTTVQVELSKDEVKRELAEMLRYARLSEVEEVDEQGVSAQVAGLADFQREGSGEVPVGEVGGQPGPGETA